MALQRTLEQVRFKSKLEDKCKLSFRTPSSELNSLRSKPVEACSGSGSMGVAAADDNSSTSFGASDFSGPVKSSPIPPVLPIFTVGRRLSERLWLRLRLRLCLGFHVL